MGRAKVTLTKTQKLAFVQIKNGLTKKVSKFSSKFGVEACLIVNDDDDSRSMTWQQDSTIVRSMLEKYKQQKIEDATPKELDVKEFFCK